MVYDIIGTKGKYRELVILLNNDFKIELKFFNKKYFKTFTLNKIKETANKISKIVDEFNNNVDF